MKNNGTKIFLGIIAIAALLFCGVLFGRDFTLSEGDLSDLSQLFGTDLATPDNLPYGGADTATPDSIDFNGADTVSPGSIEFDGADTASPDTETAQGTVTADGTYISAYDVAAYIAAYSRLPDNFITRDEARALGWNGGDLSGYAPGKSIGGDVFGNYEGLLPQASGRTWYECDVNYTGGSRGAERVVYSDDGLIYYTADHYESFTEVAP